jgi:sodium-independent sulfate anion transporter 11
VNNVDITSVQGLIDLRNTLDRYAAPTAVEWHFAGVLNRWTRRTLAVAGFGYPSADNPDELGHWSPAYTVASSLAGATADDERRAAALQARDKDEEKRSPPEHAVEVNEKMGNAEDTSSEVREVSTETGDNSLLAPVYGVDRPFFHIDLVDAVDAAVRDARSKDEGRAD